MITRQRTITQQFSQQKSLRSTAAKSKAATIGVNQSSPAAAAAETTAPQAKRFRSSKREIEAVSVKRTIAAQKHVSGNTIESCFIKAAAKSSASPVKGDAPSREAEQPQTPCPVSAAIENLSTGDVVHVEQLKCDVVNVLSNDCSDYPKFRTVEELVKRRSGLLKDKDNTRTIESEKSSPSVLSSVSVAHKTEVFSENLKLPVPYETLLNQFIAADRCISLMDNRSETVTFAKLKAAVETATKRTFTDDTLGQILHVFPGCFKLSYNQTYYNSANVELTIRADCMAGVDKEDIQLSPQSHLTVTLMRKRQTICRQNLLKLVFESHANYLKSLSPGLSVQLDVNKLRRWHPSFPLETATPVITAAQMPIRPGTSGTPRHWTAKDILERYARNTPHLAKLIEQKPAEVSNARVPPIDAPSTPNSFKVIKSGPFAGLREDLVAKVRERERRDKELQTIADPAADLNRIRHGRLPKLIRIIRGLFFRGTVSVSLKDLLSTVRYSWTSPISDDEVRATFDLLVSVCPQWIRVLIVSISRDPLVQIDTEADINSLIAKLPVEA